MPGNENTKSGILQGSFICRTSELNPRTLKNKPDLKSWGTSAFSLTLHESVMETGPIIVNLLC